MMLRPNGALEVNLTLMKSVLDITPTLTAAFTTGQAMGCLPAFDFPRAKYCSTCA
jgi:hypothetical protein